MPARKAGSGVFTWTQVRDELDFSFRGPVGIGGFRIDGDGDRLHLKTSAGEELYLTDPERDLRERYGWSIPSRACVTGCWAPGPRGRSGRDARRRE
jgi:outer membrane biogenesis lipoprotein LolB